MKTEKLKHFAKSYLYGLMGIASILAVIGLVFAALYVLGNLLIYIKQLNQYLVPIIFGILLTIGIGLVVDKCRKDKVF